MLKFSIRKHTVVLCLVKVTARPSVCRQKNLIIFYLRYRCENEDSRHETAEALNELGHEAPDTAVVRPTRQETVLAINSPKNNKAARLDGIQVELISVLHEIVKEI